MGSALYPHILSAGKRTLLDEDLPGGFLEAVALNRKGLVGDAECMFAWFWLADLCEDESTPFTFGPSLGLTL